MKKKEYHDLCSMLNQFDVFDPNSDEDWWRNLTQIKGAPCFF
jgi:hypothetical protein